MTATPRAWRSIEAGERLTSQRAATVGVTQAPHGSLSRVIDSWYLSPDFKRLAPLTQRGHRSIAERLRTARGTEDVRELSLSDIKALMAEKADTPSAANNLLKTLRPLLDHAMDDLELI